MINFTGSIGWAYIALFAISAASVVATWWALTLRFSNAVALTAAAVFAISPLVSIRPFLNGVASPVSILLLVAASLLYVSGWRILSYLVAALILFCYELVFPLFVLLPAMLKPLRTRRDLYRLLGHAVICVAMVGASAVFKGYYGGPRLSSTLAGHGALDLAIGVADAIARSFANGVVGSVDLPLWLDRLKAAPGPMIWGALGFVWFIYVLYRLAPVAQAAGPAGPADRRLTAQTVVVLLLMVVAGYALTYFAAPEGAGGVFDRDSRLHSAANLPLSILTGMALVGLLGMARPGWPRYAVIAAEAACLGIMFGFSISHQDDFVAMAKRQRQFVSQLAIDHPMMDPQATFIIQVPYQDRRHRPSIEYADNHSPYLLLRALFDFGAQGPGPAIRLFVGNSWVQALTLGPDGRLDWPAGTWPPDPEHAGHIWCYEWTPEGKLMPLRTPILVGGRNILHEGPDAIDGMVNLGQLPRLPLYKKLMGPDAANLDAALRNVAAAEPALDSPAAN